MVEGSEEEEGSGGEEVPTRPTRYASVSDWRIEEAFLFQYFKLAFSDSWCG